MTPAEFAAKLGLTIGAMPANFEVKANDDPTYMKVVSTPAEEGVDDQVSLLVMSDGTAAPAEQSPYDPTNAGDPVTPQQVSQSAGSAPYPDGILHAFPSENVPPVVPPVGP